MLEILSIILIHQISYEENYYFLTKNLYNLLCQAYQNFLLTSEYLTAKMSNGNLIISKTHKIILEKLNLKSGEECKTILRKNNNILFNSIKSLIE